MKLLGAGLVALAGVLVGLISRAQLGQRVERRRGLCQLLSLLAFELERFQRPLPELFAALEPRLDGCAGTLCCCVSGQLSREPSFSRAWACGMETLETQEREILAPLGAVLGCYGVSEQLAAVALCSRQMEDALSQAQQALQERGRMYMSLSAVGGLMLAILLM